MAEPQFPSSEDGATGPRRSTYTPPQSQPETGASAPAQGDPAAAQNVAAASVGGWSAEQVAQYQNWEQQMFAIGTPEAIAEVQRVRAAYFPQAAPAAPVAPAVPQQAYPAQEQYAYPAEPAAATQPAQPMAPQQPAVAQSSAPVAQPSAPAAPGDPYLTQQQSFVTGPIGEVPQQGYVQPTGPVQPIVPQQPQYGQPVAPQQPQFAQPAVQQYQQPVAPAQPSYPTGPVDPQWQQPAASQPSAPASAPADPFVQQVDPYASGTTSVPAPSAPVAPAAPQADATPSLGVADDDAFVEPILYQSWATGSAQPQPLPPVPPVRRPAPPFAAPQPTPPAAEVPAEPAQPAASTQPAAPIADEPAPGIAAAGAAAAAAAAAAEAAAAQAAAAAAAASQRLPGAPTSPYATDGDPTIEVEPLLHRSTPRPKLAEPYEPIEPAPADAVLAEPSAAAPTLAVSSPLAPSPAEPVVAQQGAPEVTPTESFLTAPSAPEAPAVAETTASAVPGMPAWEPPSVTDTLGVEPVVEPVVFEEPAAAAPAPIAEEPQPLGGPLLGGPLTPPLTEATPASGASLLDDDFSIDDLYPTQSPLMNSGAPAVQDALTPSTSTPAEAPTPAPAADPVAEAAPASPFAPPAPSAPVDNRPAWQSLLEDTSELAPLGHVGGLLSPEQVQPAQAGGLLADEFSIDELYPSSVSQQADLDDLAAADVSAPTAEQQPMAAPVDQPEFQAAVQAAAQATPAPQQAPATEEAVGAEAQASVASVDAAPAAPIAELGVEAAEAPVTATAGEAGAEAAPVEPATEPTAEPVEATVPPRYIYEPPADAAPPQPHDDDEHVLLTADEAPVSDVPASVQEAMAAPVNLSEPSPEEPPALVEPPQQIDTYNASLELVDSGAIFLPPQEDAAPAVEVAAPLAGAAPVGFDALLAEAAQADDAAVADFDALLAAPAAAPAAAPTRLVTNASGEIIAEEGAGLTATGVLAALGEPVEQPVTPPASTAEQVTVEPSPLDQRAGEASRMFWLWFAVNASFLTVLVGVALLGIGLNLRQALIATAVGAAVSVLPIALGTLAGKWSGQPTLVVSRAAFGLAGNILPAIAVLVARLFWAAVLLWLFATSIVRVAELTGIAPLIGVQNLQLLSIALGAVIALAVAGKGFHLLLRVQTALSLLSLLLVVAFIALTVGELNLSAALAKPDGNWLLVASGAGIVFAVVGLAFASSTSDVARYQRTSSSGGGAAASAALGAVLPAVLLIAYGALLAASNEAIATGFFIDPWQTIASLIGAEWYPIPLLLGVGLSLLSGIAVSFYSTGLAFASVGIRSSRVLGVVVAGLVAAGLAVLATAQGIAFDSFGTMVVEHAVLLAVPVAAWAGIFTGDLMTRTRRFDTRGLVVPGGAYPQLRIVNFLMFLVLTGVGLGLVTFTLPWLSWTGYLTSFVAGVPVLGELVGTPAVLLLITVVALLVPIVTGIPSVRKQEQQRRMVLTNSQEA